MKIFIFSLFFLAIAQPLVAQKHTLRVIDAGGVERLELFMDEVYKVNLKTSAEDKISFTTNSEGEYYKDIHLDMESHPQKVVITSRFPERLKSGFDKLSAHKVFSLEVDLVIPEGVEVYLRSNIAGVNASGNYRNLQVELEGGSCRLFDFKGNAVVNTYRGSIWVETVRSSITAFSRNGKVDIPAPVQGKYSLDLQTINGDIRVREN